MTVKEFNKYINNMGADSSGLSAIYKKYHKSMYNVAYYILNEATMAEDVVSQVFCKLFTEKPTAYINHPNDVTPKIRQVKKGGLRGLNSVI